MTSDFLSLNRRDYLKALGLTVLTAMTQTLGATFAAGVIPSMEQFRASVVSGIYTGFVYLLVNFFSSPSTPTLPAAPPVEPTTDQPEPGFEESSQPESTPEG